MSGVATDSTGRSGAVTAARYSGHVTYIFAFDLAYEMARMAIPQLLGQKAEQFQVDANKRAPRQLFFYRPQMVRLPAVTREAAGGSGGAGGLAGKTLQLERQVKIFPIGGISFSVRVAFDVASISELVHFHDLRFSNGSSLHDEVLATVEEIRRELRPYLIRPVERLADEEAYTVFCITSSLDAPGGPHLPTEGWLADHRREIAALLTEERDTTHLSDQESVESTSRYLSYYDHDMVVIDWDAALVVDEPRYIDEMIHLIELANLQLAELETYDRLLDEVIDRSYRDLSTAALRAGGAFGRKRWTGAKTLKELREMRIDLARLSDELSNITKFFGDWHLARIYQALSARFHLADWHRTTDEKLKTLDDLYQLLQNDRNNRYMLILEVTIVLLFVIDLVMLFRFGR